jgi:bifunctional N-acetylglucosamine-1-phosphate-uridyltransferase/glucosamine-1-phosphate-acetyltransferase GlmU-like protein
VRADEHRAALGFMTIDETENLADEGVRVLDPFSTLISSGVLIGPDTIIYPGVVLRGRSNRAPGLISPAGDALKMTPWPVVRSGQRSRISR